MRTSDVANAAGVNVETMRYYERRGLLPPPGRRASGYRDYAPEAVKRVQFIKRAQALGFTLREIAELLTLRDSTAAPKGADLPDARVLAGRKVAAIDAKLAQLGRMRGALLELMDTCDGECGSTRECPIIEALEDDPAPAAPPRRITHRLRGAS